MEIYPTDSPLDLVVAYVIEPFEAGALDGSDAVVGNEEMLFPSHEYIFAIPPFSPETEAWPSRFFG